MHLWDFWGLNVAVPATGGQSPTTTITSPGHKKNELCAPRERVKDAWLSWHLLGWIALFQLRRIPWQYEVAAGKSCSCGIIHRCSSMRENAVEEEVLHDCIITLVSKMLCLCLSDPLVILSRSLAGTSTAYRCAERWKTLLETEIGV